MRLRRLRCLVLLLLLNSIVPAPVLAQLSSRSPLQALPPQTLAQAPDPRQAEALRLLQEGVKQYGASQFTAAAQSFQQALKLYQALNDRSGQWFALYLLGILHTSIRDFTKGTDYLQQSLEIARALGDRVKQSDTLVALGNAALGVGEPTKAADYYEQNLTVVREIPDRDREAKALSSLIQLYQSLGQAEKVKRYQQQLAALTRQPGGSQPSDSDARTQAMQAIQAGQRLQRQGTRTALEQSLQQFETALALGRKSQDTQLQALALLALGTSYTELGQHRRTIATSNQVLQLSRTQPQLPIIEATAYLGLGVSYRNLGEVQKSLEAYNQALRILEKAGDRSGQGTVLNNIGTALLTLGRYQEAFDFYNRSLALSKQTGDRSGQAKSLGNLGLAYASLGLYQQALDHYSQSLSLLRDLKEGRALEATVLHNQGVVYVFLGQRPKALDYFRQSLTLLQDGGDRSQQAYVLSDLGTVYSYEDNRKAIDYYNQALELARTVGNRDVEAVVLGNLGQAYLELDQSAQALTYYNQALALARSVGSLTSEATTLGQLGIVAYGMKEYAKSVQLLQQGLTLIQQVGDLRLEGLLLRSMGKSLLAVNQPGAAEARLRESARVMELIRAGLGSNDLNKVSIFEEQSLTYRLLQQALIAQNKVEAALEVAERGRARAFVEQLTQHYSGQAQTPSVTPPSIQQIQQIAKAQNATLVEYSILDDELNRIGNQPAKASTLLIWVVQPTGSVTLRQVDLSQLPSKALSLEDLVAQMRQAVGVRGLAVVADAGTLSTNQRSESQTSQLQQLHRILIQPIADLLPTDPQAQVIFIPQGPLFMVPFAALQNAAGQYLIERHTLRIAPAIQVLDLTHRRRQALQQGNPQNALVVGNPTMPQVQLAAGETALPLPALPGAEREARTIASLLQTQALTGDAATKTTVLTRMRQADIIHLATHGLLNDFKGLGLPGAIALAPDRNARPGSGLLTADEILDLNLKARLVVLSACDTGRGQITGDGVIGLSRSFIAAGVPSIVVSLWAVADAPTAALMTEFYQALKQNPDQAQALRQAMLATLKQYPEPRNWAAFMLIGEAK